MKRLLCAALLLAACDHDADVSDAAPSLSAIIPPLPPPSLSPTPSLSQSPTLTATPQPSASAGQTCGAKGLPDCPLQAWMKANMNPPLEKHDWQGIASALDRAAPFAPAGYTNWVSITKDGANAARAAELEAIKAACRGCHEQYKTKYRTEMRLRPIP
jgi:hypothetical protein